MKAVVTGGPGFVGSHLVERLSSENAQVVCIEHPRADRRWLERAAVDFRPCGLACVDELTDHLRGADVVYHLAALTKARRPEDYYQVNTEGTASIVKAAARQQTPPLIVLASSLAAIGPSTATEDLSDRTTPHPLTHYGNSKLLAEAVMHSYADEVPSVVFRLSSVYGPRELALLKLFQMIRHGLALTVGSWDREASLLYVHDLVDAFMMVTKATNAVGRTFCLAHPTPTTWEQFALLIGRALDRRPKLISVPRPVAQGIAIAAEFGAWVSRSSATLNREKICEITQERWVCDVTRTLEMLRFVPQYPVERGVQLTADWYRQNGWI